MTAPQYATYPCRNCGDPILADVQPSMDLCNSCFAGNPVPALQLVKNMRVGAGAFDKGGWWCGFASVSNARSAKLQRQIDFMEPDKATPDRELQGAIRLFRTWRISVSVEHMCPTKAKWLGVEEEPDWLWEHLAYFDDMDEGPIPAPEHWRLAPLISDAHAWTPGENVGDDPAHGLYGFHSFDELVRQEPSAQNIQRYRVAGTILAYGRIVVGDKGARASHAVIESLIEPSDPAEALKLLGLSGHYGCQIISEEKARNLPTGLVPYRKGTGLL